MLHMERSALELRADKSRGDWGGGGSFSPGGGMSGVVDSLAHNGKFVCVRGSRLSGAEFYEHLKSNKLFYFYLWPHFTAQRLSKHFLFFPFFSVR